MATPSALNRVQKYVQEFCEALARCDIASIFSSADHQDALNRLARLRDRFQAERRHLTHGEARALAKALDEDAFIQGMLDGRQIGEHVTNRRGAVIRTPRGTPITLEAQTSAMSFFADQLVRVSDVKGNLHELDHLARLKEAEKRIVAAMRNAASGDK
jgi:hypothetical protein